MGLVSASATVTVCCFECDALDRRPRLAEALAKARKAKAPVVVAKLCRLSRAWLLFLA
jgi:hypothetical protein